jgi:hypothetical protein
MGRFKNKKVVVKTIGTDDWGMPTINGKKVATFRIPKKEELKEAASNAGFSGTAEPDTSFVADRQKRILNKEKPENWYKQGGYTQLDKPKADNMRGVGKTKDTETQFRKSYYKINNVEKSTLNPADDPHKVEDWKEIKPKKAVKKPKRFWELPENQKDTIISKEDIKEIVSDFDNLLDEMGLGGGAGVGLSLPGGYINGAPDSDDVKKNSKKLNNKGMSGYEEIDEEADTIPGGLAKGMTLTDIAKHHNISPQTLKNEFIKGYAIEREHTTDINIAKEIALDHLYEDPNYYSKLSKIEIPYNEGFTKGQIFAGKMKVGGRPVNVEVELVGSDNKKNEFITKIIFVDKGYERQLPIGSKLPIPARIFRTPGGGWRKIKTPSAFENVTEATTSDIIKDLDKVKNDLIKKVDVLIAKKKKLYSNMDIESPMSADEKKLDKDIQSIFSQIQQLIQQKRKIKENTIIEYTGNGAFPQDGNTTTGYIWNSDLDDYDKQKYYLDNLEGWDFVDDIPSEREKKTAVDQTLPIDNHKDKTDKYNRILKYNLKSPIDFLKESLLMEGGAYGHMNHPFDIEMNLTFADLKSIVTKALNGDLELTREKTDGQALAVSWVNGRLVAARNKSHLKSKGAGAMTIGQVAEKFGGRGGLTDAYNFAMQDLSNAIAALSEPQRQKIFKDGACFMNLEVIYPTSVNVIPYNQPLLVFHGTFEYDDAGTIIGENQQAASILGGMIKQVNAHVQSKYTIQGPPMTKLPKSEDLAKLQGKYLGMISKLQSEFGLSDNDGVGEYHQAWWSKFVEKGGKKLDAQEKIGLVKRWAFNDKSFRIATIQDPKLRAWAEQTDKQDQQKISKQNLMRFEEIFLGVGADVLSFMDSVLTANPDSAKRQMVARLQSTISQVKASGDPKKIEKLKLELTRLNALGGFEKIVPNEGIVFVYGGNTYKLTGAFAPLNQILGIFFDS